MTVGAGITGPDLASHLGDRGLTIGHEPQSWELATVGGWVAARGIGPALASARGASSSCSRAAPWRRPPEPSTMPPFPASAAGPDLRQLVLGSEGRLGFLTDVILRTSPLPEVDRLEAYALPGWGAGHECVRAHRPGAHRAVSVLRLSTPGESRTLLAFADRPPQIRALDDLPARPPPAAATGRCSWSGAAGRKRLAKAARDEARGDHRRPRRRRDPRPRGDLVEDPLPLAVPAQRAVDHRLRLGHARDGHRLGARADAPRPPRGRRRRAPSRPSASGSTSSRTSRTCTRPARASTSPTCSASRRDPTRRWSDGRRSSGRPRPSSRPRARRSPTTTAWAPTTRRTSSPRRDRWAWPRSSRSSARSTPTG